MNSLALLAILCSAAPAPAKFAPIRAAGELVLFDAGQHDPALVRNYTARWKKESDLVPSGRPVAQDGQAWVEFTFRGSRGMSCSTLYFEKAPDPAARMRYQGLELEIDCQRDDYPHIGVQVSFADGSQLSHDLAFDLGRHKYVVERGFRREKHPPPWALVSHVMLTLTAERQAPQLCYRLRRIVLRQVNADAPGVAPAGPVADRFAEPLLTPRPKQLAWHEGAFPAARAWPLCVPKSATARTRRTAELFADQYFELSGFRPALGTFDGTVPDAGIVLQLAGQEEKLKPQGYTLAVEPGRVVIAGADEPGLYYGTVTFFQLLRHALKRVAEAPQVPCAAIVDWPDTPNRLLRLEHPHTFRNYPVRENRGIDYLIQWTDRFVAGNKFNTFYVDLSANVRYARRPEMNGSDKLYSLADLRRFGDFCRDRFIDLCPAFQVGGHANWWLTIGYHPELRAKGWKSQGDVTHPDHDPIVYDCMLDVIEALRPKYLSPKSDEWWHERKPDETPDALLHGKTPAEAFLDFHLKLHAWLRQRGITMMIYEDMLSPYHNGKRFDTYRVIDRFPKDVILTLWSGGNTDREIRYFTERGLRVWPNATGMFTLSPESKGRVMGFGKGIYSFGNDKSRLLDEYSPLWSMSNVLRVGDYAWNFSGGDDADPARLVALEHLLAIGSNPSAGARVEPLDVGPAMTHSFAALMEKQGRTAALPGGVRPIGFVPTRLPGGQGKDCVVLGKGSAPVALPVRGRFASLVFLHSAVVNDPADKNVAGVRIREWIYGWPCGNYVVHYADGTQAVLPVRLTNNVKRFDTAPATRAALDTRYTWTLADSHGAPVHVFQWEWVNPKPDVAITSVSAEHDNHLDVSLVLVALSGRAPR